MTCIFHDSRDGNTIVTMGSLVNNFYKLDQGALAADTQTVSNTELWHAQFGHLNFSSAAWLSKHDMVCNFPSIHIQ